MCIFTRQEHDISNHGQRSTCDEEYQATVDAPADEWYQYCKESSYDIWRHSTQLLEYDAVLRIDSCNNRRREECKALDSDIVEQENECCYKGVWVPDTLDRLGLIQFVKNLSCTNTFGLDTGFGEILLFLGKPTGGLGPVGQGEETDDGQTDGDDAFNCKYHAPVVQATEM